MSAQTYLFYQLDTSHIDDEMELIKVKKVNRLLKAVVQNDVDALREALDSPKWYEVKNWNGLNLLHIAIIENSRRAFDYMLSLEDFPIDMVNDFGPCSGQTPLMYAMLHNQYDYVSALIYRGADIFSPPECLPLHYMAFHGLVSLGEYLIEKGVDIDAQDERGNTPLHEAVDSIYPDAMEFIEFLLLKGANPRIRNEEGKNPFEVAIGMGYGWGTGGVSDNLFYYTYDEHTKFETDFSVLMELAKGKSDLVFECHDLELRFPPDFYENFIYHDLKYLTFWLEKFPEKIKSCLKEGRLHRWIGGNCVTLEKIELFIHSDLKEEMIECIQNTDDRTLISSCDGLSENELTDIICYLLSYGFEITFSGLQLIYKRYGYGELLKIVLHMDIEMNYDIFRNAFPALLCNLDLDLQTYLDDDYQGYLRINGHELVHYFANEKLNKILLEWLDEHRISTISSLPKVPLLVELARNSFREYFIKTFKIKTSSQFYTLLNNLKISIPHKKIISYETKLY